jgi:hydroxyacylglutathione hydrolase
MTEIARIPLGADNCYMVRDRGVVAIDCGMPGASRAFQDGLKRASVEPAEVTLIVVTHAHWDHIGLAKEMKGITGAPLALHRSEQEWLEGPQIALPSGTCLWGRFLCLPMVLLRKSIRITPTEVDVVIGDEGLSLEPYGISGKVIHTPGHSPGSVTILLDSGEAFVGDMAMSLFPMTLRPGLPIFAHDCKAMRESWKHLLSLGITKIYPAHGTPFDAAIMKRIIEKSEGPPLAAP